MKGKRRKCLKEWWGDIKEEKMVREIEIQINGRRNCCFRKWCEESYTVLQAISNMFQTQMKHVHFPLLRCENITAWQNFQHLLSACKQNIDPDTCTCACAVCTVCVHSLRCTWLCLCLCALHCNTAESTKIVLPVCRPGPEGLLGPVSCPLTLKPMGRRQLHGTTNFSATTDVIWDDWFKQGPPVQNPCYLSSQSVLQIRPVPQYVRLSDLISSAERYCQWGCWLTSSPSRSHNETVGKNSHPLFAH